MCSTLWCTVGATCHSKLDGAVDGTSCGDDKVRLSFPERVEGIGRASLTCCRGALVFPICSFQLREQETWWPSTPWLLLCKCTLNFNQIAAETQTTLKWKKTQTICFSWISQRENVPEYKVLCLYLSGQYDNKKKLPVCERASIKRSFSVFHQWCFGGECVAVGSEPESVDGGWAAWSEWLACSRTCGVGVRSAHRHCENPV